MTQAKTSKRASKAPKAPVPAPVVTAQPDLATERARQLRPFFLWALLMLGSLGVFLSLAQRPLREDRQYVAGMELDLASMKRTDAQMLGYAKGPEFGRFKGVDDKAFGALQRAVWQRIRAAKDARNKALEAQVLKEASTLDRVDVARRILAHYQTDLDGEEKKLRNARASLQQGEKFRRGFLALLLLPLLALLRSGFRVGRSVGWDLVLEANLFQFYLLLALPAWLPSWLGIWSGADPAAFRSWACLLAYGLAVAVWHGRHWVSWCFPIALSVAYVLGFPDPRQADTVIALTCVALVLGLLRAKRAFVRQREAQASPTSDGWVWLSIRNYAASVDGGLSFYLARALWRSGSAVLGWSAVEGGRAGFLVASALWAGLDFSVFWWVGWHVRAASSLGQWLLWVSPLLLALIGHCVWARSRPRPAFRWSSAAKFVPLSLATVLSFLLGAWLLGMVWIGLGHLALANTQARFERQHFELSLPPTGVAVGALVPLEKVPDQYNAAPLLDQARVAYRALSLTAQGTKQMDADRALIRSIINQSLLEARPAYLTLTADVVARYQPILALERRALLKPHAQWQVPPKDYYWSVTSPLLFDHFVIGRLLLCDGILDLGRGHKEAALNCVKDLRTLSRLLGEHPGPMGQTMAVYLESSALDLESLLLARAWLPVPAGKPGSQAERMQQGMRWQLAMDVHDFKKMNEVWWSKGLFKKDRLSTLDDLQPLLNFWIADELALAGRIMDQLKQEPLPEQKQFDDLFDHAPRIFTPTLGMMEHISQYWRSQYARGLEADQRRVLINAGMQCQLFKKRTGRWPIAAWELGLAADAIKDKFSGKSLKLLPRDGGGVLLYSIGADDADDQGAPLKDGHGDLSVTVM